MPSMMVDKYHKCSNMDFYPTFLWVFTPFLGSKMRNRVNVIPMDNCISDYISFKHNIGIGNVFSNSILGLCCFHLEIQGSTIHVSSSVPNSGVCFITAAATTKIITKWVKSTFVIESENEYTYSKHALFRWLQLRKDTTLTVHLIETVRVRVKSNVFTRSALWLIYLCLNIYGMGVITTSSGKSLHWSMKSRSSEIRSSTSFYIAAKKWCQSHSVKVRRAQGKLQYRWPAQYFRMI